MRSKKRKAKKIKKQVNKIKMILCLVVEAIVILTLVVIIGWNKGVGDWMESLQRPVVRKLEMSGINSPYAVLMQVKGGKIIGNMKGDEKIYPASMTKIMTVIVAIENLDDLCTAQYAAVLHSAGNDTLPACGKHLKNSGPSSSLLS